MAISPFASVRNNPVNIGSTLLSQPATQASPMMQPSEPAMTTPVTTEPDVATNPMQTAPEAQPPAEENFPAQPQELPRGVDPGVLTRIQRPEIPKEQEPAPMPDMPQMQEPEPETQPLQPQS